MLVKIKKQSELSANVLNNNNSIVRAYISRGGVEQVFDTSTTTLTFELYNFDTINDVTVEVASTSTVKHTITDATTGNYVVTAEDGTIKTYGYTITPKSYTNGLPILTSASSSDGTSKILKQVDGQSILGQVWNIGEIAKRGVNQIDTVTVQDGSFAILENVGDFDATERQRLYNGTDSYLKIWRTIDNGTSNYHKFVYYRIVTNANLFPTPITPTPVKLEYANQIGYLNFDVFIPLKSGLSIEEIYNKTSKADLITYLTAQNITHFTSVLWTSVDTTYVTNYSRDLSWNDNFDKGFVLADVMGMSKTFGLKIKEVIGRAFNIAWDEYKVGKTFTDTEAEILAKQQYRITWLSTNSQDGIYEWCDYLINGEQGILEDAIKGTSKTAYIKTLKDAFRTQFTYAYLVKNLNENDVNFFKNRFTYIKDVLSSFKSDLSQDDVIGILNVFTTLEDVIKLNKISGQSSATRNMNVSITRLVEKSDVMILKDAFA